MTRIVLFLGPVSLSCETVKASVAMLNMLWNDDSIVVSSTSAGNEQLHSAAPANSSGPLRTDLGVPRSPEIDMELDRKSQALGTGSEVLVQVKRLLCFRSPSSRTSTMTICVAVY